MTKCSATYAHAIQIRTDPEQRPKASKLVDTILIQSEETPHPDLFVARCCSRSDSLAPIDPVDSPTLAEQSYNGPGLGIDIINAPASPPLRFLEVNRSHSQSPVRSERRGSRDRSVSPRSQSAYTNAREDFQSDMRSDVRAYNTDTVSSLQDAIQSYQRIPMRQFSNHSQ